MQLAHVLDDTAQRVPKKTALYFSEHALSYAELQERVCRLASSLMSLGVAKGHHVVFASANTGAFPEVVFACARLGAVCEVHNVRLAAVQLAELIKKSSARVLIVAPDVCEKLAACLSDLDRDWKVIVLGESYERLIAQGDISHQMESVEADDPVLMLFTSGTTGLPKGVVLSHGAVLNRIRVDVSSMSFTGHEVMLFVLPFYHVTCMSVFAVVATGAQMVVGTSSKVEDIVDDVLAYGVTRVGLLPYHMRQLAAYAEREGVCLSTLSLIIYGAEPAGVPLVERCRELLGCDLLCGYGMTETSSTVTVLSPQHHKVSRLLSTVGLPVEGAQIRVVDECGNTCSAYASGEVFVKCDTFMLGYEGNVEASAQVMQDGWYKTRDIGFLDDEGFLTLVDRKDNMVITGGENVYPSEVARCIESLGESIEDVVVVGVPDERWGESLAAFVVLAAGAKLTADEVKSHCACRLGSFKKPRYVLFVDDLGRKAAGKIPGERLAELVNLLR